MVMTLNFLKKNLMAVGEVGKKIISIIFKGVFFILIQIFLEIVINLILEYSGIIRSEDFSPNTLFISAALYIAWITMFIKLKLIWLYLSFFGVLRFKLKNVSNGFIHLIACLGSSLLIVFYDNDLTDIIKFFIPIIIACILVLIGERLHFSKKTIK